MTAEELLKDRLEEYHYRKDTVMVTTAFLDMFAKDYATMRCKELLEIVADKADIYIPDGAYMDCYVNPSFIEIDRSSILNAVDLDEFIV